MKLFRAMHLLEPNSYQNDYCLAILSSVFPPDKILNNPFHEIIEIKNEDDCTDTRQMENSKEPFICSHCYSSFIEKGSLAVPAYANAHLRETSVLHFLLQRKKITIHTIFHSNEKLFSCSFCCSSFSKMCNLGMHNNANVSAKLFI